MSKENTPETYFEADTHFDGIIHLPSAAGTDSMPETFKDFLDYLLDFDEDHEILKISAFKRYFKGEDEEDLRESLCMPGNLIKGFIFKMVATVHSRVLGCKAIRSSWGHCHFAWGYAETWEDAESKLLQWAEAMHKEDMEADVHA